MVGILPPRGWLLGYGVFGRSTDTARKKFSTALSVALPLPGEMSSAEESSGKRPDLHATLQPPDSVIVL